MGSDTIRLADELAALRAQVNKLEQEKSDLEIELQAAVEHGDAIEAELAFANDQMRGEIVERIRVEAKLKKLLEVLREQKEDLELIVQTITEHSDDIDVERELANEQLRLENERIRLAKEQAETLARIKAEFIAVVSHEVRTPMNGMLGMARLLLDTPLSAEQRDMAETVVSSGRLLLAILDDILDLSKLEAGGLQLERIEFDLVQMVEESLSLMATKAAERGLAMAHHCHPAIPRMVGGDPTRLRQMLLNLLGNALKFTEKGSVTLRVAPDGDGFVRFAVADTGIGIAEDARGRLFQRYSQVEAWVSRKFGGTGLGLSICKQLAELMGGEIGVDSVPGAGSTFWFRIPLAAAEAPGLRARPAHPPARVLLAEPDPAVRRLLAARLGDWGIAVAEIEAPGLAEAWRPGDVLLIGGRHKLGAAVPAADRPDMPSIVLHPAGTMPSARPGAAVIQLGEPVGETALADALDWLALPAEARPSRTAALPAGDGGAAGPELRRLDLLLVEDNVVNRRVAAAVLTRRGHGVVAVENGAEAVAAVKRQHFDAVLMDRHMPLMDGIEATRAIRALDGPAGGVPIIALTASVAQAEIQECLAAGMDDFVPKPYTPDQLFGVLARVVGAAGEAAGDFDPAMLAGIRDSLGDAFADQVVPFFVESATKLLDAVEQAVTYRDAGALAEAVHPLKSAAGQVGLMELQRLCAAAETSLSEGRIEDALSLAGRLPEAFTRGCARLKA